VIDNLLGRFELKRVVKLSWAGQSLGEKLNLARTSHQVSTAAAYPGMSASLRSLGLLDVLSSTPAGPSVARLVSMPACAASLRNPVRNAG
jgi:hypothetical protein